MRLGHRCGVNRFILAAAVLAATGGSTTSLSGCGEEASDGGVTAKDTTNDGGLPDVPGDDAGVDRPTDGSAPDDASPIPPDAAPPEPDGGSTPCWAFDRPTLTALRASKKKVFAHYFSAYPLSLDNQPAATDYYARNYLVPEGEGGKFYAGGGLITQRPVPQTPRPAGTDWLELNMATEVRRAAAIGLDGFTYDLLASSGPHWDRLKALLRAIPKADPGFTVLLTVDMTTTSFGGGNPRASDADARKAFVDAVAAVAADPSLWHLPDGRLVLSAYYSSNPANKRSAAFWKSVFDDLAAKGIRGAFVPMPNGAWQQDTDDMVAAGVPVYAPTTWANRTVSTAPATKTYAAQAHAKGLLWMGPIGPQDGRPKDLTFIEVQNTRSFRAGWDAAISGGADLVQMITWSDYSEASEIAPSSKIHNAFFDLTAFYTTWFKTGAMPTIARDVLFYSHRVNPVGATVTKGGAYRSVNGPAGEDFIEVVGLLTAPGTLAIESGGQTRTADVGAGVQSFRVPLAAGTPTFRLLRDGKPVVSFSSGSPVKGNTVEFFDPLNHAGSSMTCPLPD